MENPLGGGYDLLIVYSVIYPWVYASTAVLTACTAIALGGQARLYLDAWEQGSTAVSGWVLACTLTDAVAVAVWQLRRHPRAA